MRVRTLLCVLMHAFACFAASPVRACTGARVLTRVAIIYRVCTLACAFIILSTSVRAYFQKLGSEEVALFRILRRNSEEVRALRFANLAAYAVHTWKRS